MGCIGCDVGEETFILLSCCLDEVHGCVKVDIRAVAFHRSLHTILDESWVCVFAFCSYGVGRLANSSATMN